MKLQIDHQRLRVRVDEAEFARLLEWDTLTATTALPGASFTLELRPVAGGPLELQVVRDCWRLQLPLPLLFDYRTRLPCRDGIEVRQAVGANASLQLAFEVDVRDSVRTRGPQRRCTGDDRSSDSPAARTPVP